MMTLVSSRKVAMLAAGYFLEAPFVLAAQLVHPFGSAMLQLGMVLVPPRAGCGFTRRLRLKGL